MATKFRKFFIAALMETDADEMRFNGEETVIKFAVDIGVIDYIDVGANCGEWSASVIKFSSRMNSLVLYEPNKTYIHKLNDDFNHLSYVEIYNNAISSTAGEVNFVESGVFSKISENGDVTVTSVNNKELAERHLAGKRYLIKIDTEGFDAEVLGEFSMTGITEKSLVQIEFGPEQVKRGITVEEYSNILSQHTPFIVTRRKLLDIHMIELFDGALLNILFVPSDDLNFLSLYNGQ
jgi:FkbM family methyltransferase